MHETLHPKVDINRLFVSRKEGRGLASIEASMDASIRRFVDYIKKNKERLITAVNNSSENTRTNRTTINRKEKREDKQLYG